MNQTIDVIMFKEKCRKLSKNKRQRSVFMLKGRFFNEKLLKHCR